MIEQEELVFFGVNDPLGRQAPSEEWKKARVDPQNPESPFSKFIGNERAVRKMQVAAFDALGRSNRVSRDLAFSIFGPSSAGKTTLARLYAEVLDLPFIELSPKSIKTLDDVFKRISKSLAQQDLPLVEFRRGGYYVMPPCVILLDEAHAIVDSVVQGLLKATEYGDAMLVTESGKTVNTWNVTWMMATTDEGKLFDAFRTRFSPVHLQYLAKKDVARIVRLANSDLSEDVCLLVAHYNSRIPRKALEFARYMKMVKGMHSGKDWTEIAREVATDEGIDEHGMHEVHVRILRALGQGPVAMKRMPIIVGRKEEEVERFVMPWLLQATEDQPALVTVSSRGYTITEDGLKELDRRHIAHKGTKALAA